jgi:trans-2,3-dihydro-3-hydroxyanthranilate isomerase
MSEFVPFRLIDAFAEEPFRGNPAGVVLLADGLDAGQMQAIAREVNASETAFICGGNDLHRPPRLRWFTPGVEVGFCGHATLAAAHAWWQTQRESGRPAVFHPLTFQTAAGELRLRPEPLPGRDGSPMWWLRMPPPELKPAGIATQRTCELLGLTKEDLDASVPLMRTRDQDVIVLIRSWQRLMEMRPRMDELAEWSQRNEVRGFCVATLDTFDASIHVASRFFAPAAGVAEDPVTGSVHGPLAVLLVINDLVPLVAGRAALHCFQGPPGGRCGLVRALVKAAESGYGVYVGGCCETTLRGEMRVPVPTGL